MSPGALASAIDVSCGTAGGTRTCCCMTRTSTSRVVPRGEHLVSPADGTVVYVERAEPGQPVVVCKRGRSASINDIAREEFERPRILIGIFMSPFDVHYNRAPLAGTVEYTRSTPRIEELLHDVDALAVPVEVAPALPQ